MGRPSSFEVDLLAQLRARYQVSEQTPEPVDPVRYRRCKPAIAARQQGKTMRQAAAAVGVNVSTLIRWANLCPMLKQALKKPKRKPPPTPLSVPRRDECPECKGKLAIRAVDWAVRFWTCVKCDFKSWRPRAVQDCPQCGQATFWSHSRKTISCGSCGRRWQSSNPAI